MTTRHSKEIAAALAVVRALEPDLLRVVIDAALRGDREAQEYLASRPEAVVRAVELGVLRLREPGDI